MFRGFPEWAKSAIRFIVIPILIICKYDKWNLKWYKIIIAIFPFLYPYMNRWFWNRLGGDYYRSKTVYSAHHILAVNILSQVLREEKFDSLLEVGCGTADNLVRLTWAFPGKRFAGCDFSKKQLKVARNLTKIEFALADARDLPYDDKEFDVVITVGVLAHIPTKQIEKAVGELKRVTKQLIILMEEDRDFANKEVQMLCTRMGWHFYHDYRELFKDWNIEYIGDDMKLDHTALHTHIFRRKE